MIPNNLITRFDTFCIKKEICDKKNCGKICYKKRSSTETVVHEMFLQEIFVQDIFLDTNFLEKHFLETISWQKFVGQKFVG